MLEEVRFHCVYLSIKFQCIVQLFSKVFCIGSGVIGLLVEGLGNGVGGLWKAEHYDLCFDY